MDDGIVEFAAGIRVGESVSHLRIGTSSLVGRANYGRLSSFAREKILVEF